MISMYAYKKIKQPKVFTSLHADQQSTNRNQIKGRCTAKYGKQDASSVTESHRPTFYNPIFPIRYVFQHCQTQHTTFIALFGSRVYPVWTIMRIFVIIVQIIASVLSQDICEPRCERVQCFFRRHAVQILIYVSLTRSQRLQC